MADLFEILADPTRRRLLEALRHGERSVGDLVDEVDIYQPGVSKQLRILYHAGFVGIRQDRQKRIYSLRPKRFRELDHWMNDFRQLWAARFDKLAAPLPGPRCRSPRARRTPRRPRPLHHDRTGWRAVSGGGDLQGRRPAS
jgi:DNA-binding transcriptional ArsR family regulator